MEYSFIPLFEPQALSIFLKDYFNYLPTLALPNYHAHSQFLAFIPEENNTNTSGAGEVQVRF